MIAHLRDAVVDYPGRGRALGPFSLSIEPGEIVAVAGPSGCGKSTALRLLAGLESPTSGVAGREVGRGATSLVFQAPTLMPWATAAANVALPLKLEGLDRSETARRVAGALARARVPDVGAALPRQLSGGMAMRVSLARAVVTEPELLLLDEPFAALDAITRRALVEDVHRLWTETRPAIVFVTHDVEEAVYLASRVVVLTPGPGRAAAEIGVDAPLPRPEAFRTSAVFRDTVERVSSALATAMGEAA
ncbi:MAG TPA: ABC transporter ATP-binding protein [Caulobacteraceae bacterium]|nr:ABC transporter ATP-binding protein [Caulobacteraceae bacterium]